eukprot:TRINITY_DN8454_c0_g3_i5.p1 TRINITY_DN8454_c0_g3~~TRINITY_DN8454_c0_g3_i5.p1  ORF type:complete len:115 (-),score=30.33 TRINITY_DN8454_c0_g3_i5:489-833(-)
MIRRPPRSTLSSSSAASDVYKRQVSTQSTGGQQAFMKRTCEGGAEGDHHKQSRNAEQLAQSSPIPTGGPTQGINYNYGGMSTANKVAHLDRLNAMVGLVPGAQASQDTEMKMAR